MTRQAISLTVRAIPMGALRMLECLVTTGLELPLQSALSEILTAVAPVDNARAGEAITSIIKMTAMPTSDIRNLASAIQETAPLLAYNLLAPTVITQGGDVETYRLLGQVQNRTNEQSQDWFLEGLKKGHKELWKDYLQSVENAMAPLFHTSVLLVPEKDNRGLNLKEPQLRANQQIYDALGQIERDTRRIAIATNDQFGFVAAMFYAVAAAVYNPAGPNQHQYIKAMENHLKNRKNIGRISHLLSAEPCAFGASYFSSLFPGIRPKIQTLLIELCNEAQFRLDNPIRKIVEHTEVILDEFVGVIRYPSRNILPYYNKTVANEAKKEMDKVNAANGMPAPKV